ncbi:MAG: hypothetical protein JJ992_05075, partial [Planctomycetes bacterium]|nr:hypothetical protein [Planctomycetota bacterium]
TANDAKARQMQRRISTIYNLDELFPVAADLPEGIPDRELTEAYGGVGGVRYRELEAEIERRLAACPDLH